MSGLATVRTQRYHTNGTYTKISHKRYVHHISHKRYVSTDITYIFIYYIYIEQKCLYIYIYICVYIEPNCIYIYTLYIHGAKLYTYITLYIYIYLCKPCLNKLPNTNPVILRRLEFLKAVRFGRSVLNELVWWASCEGLHSLGHIFIFR